MNIRKKIIGNNLQRIFIATSGNNQSLYEYTFFTMDSKTCCDFQCTTNFPIIRLDFIIPGVMILFTEIKMDCTLFYLHILLQLQF